MSENQNTEFKQSWHAGFLKTICSSANSQCGAITIGKNVKGKNIDIMDYKKLMDDLPNKTKNHLGITAALNPKTNKGKHFIEIIIPTYTVAISLRGRYNIRNGSTISELTGAMLNDFLLKKSDKTWDDVIEERAGIKDINKDTLSDFWKVAEKSGRLPDSKGLSTKGLLEKLRLTSGSQLKRTAIILFGKDLGKFFSGVSVKIGRFS